MREIRFRAWDKRNKKMIGPYEITKDCICDILIQYGSDNLIWMEFIGLLDKNKKEIYEGDIIEYENGNAGYGRPRHEEISRSVVPLMTDYVEYEMMSLWWRDGKIIGNIYENKGKNNE